MRDARWIRLLVIAVAVTCLISATALAQLSGLPSPTPQAGGSATAARVADIEKQIEGLTTRKAEVDKKLHDAREKAGILADPAVTEAEAALKAAKKAYEDKVAALKAADPNAGEAVLKNRAVVKLAAECEKAQKALDNKLTELSMKNPATRELCLESMKTETEVQQMSKELERLKPKETE